MSISYRVELLPGEPILFAELGSDFVFQRDYPGLQSDMEAILGASGSFIYILFDVLKLQMNLDDLINAVNTASRGEGSLLHHPNIAHVVVATANPMITLAVKGMNNEIFGNLNIVAFQTLDEALAHARELVAISAG